MSEDEIKVKRLTAREACIRKLKVFKAKATSITVDNVTIQGVSLNDYLTQPLTSFNLGFDALEQEGIFGDRTPKKPDGINQQVWNAMLLSLKETVIPQLGLRLKKGRERLGLPDVLDDVDLVGTISIPPFFQTFPNDPAKQSMIQYWTGMGWNIEVANAAPFADLPQTPNFASQFVGFVNGDILTVTEVSYGFVSQGLQLSGAGVPAGVIILDQLTKNPTDGPFFKTGTYKLNQSFNTGSIQFTGTFPPGPRVCSIYVHYGYIEKATGLVIVKMYDLGNRQFEPTIDYDPQDDPECVTSWGEKYNGFRPLAGEMILRVADNMRNSQGALNPNNTGCIQLVILRETGILAYFPGGCDDENRSITTQITNPNCVTNCTGNATSTSSVSTTVGLDT